MNYHEKQAHSDKIALNDKQKNRSKSQCPKCNNFRTIEIKNLQLIKFKE